MASTPDLWDVIIVGAGPAGLSAALLLGRCRRRVLVFDAGRPRNAVSRAAHGVYTRDGEDPRELLRIARRQLVRYGVRVRPLTIRSVARTRTGRFELAADDGSHYETRKLLLATGIVDILPDVPGLDALYGRSAFHCPYCDGWEVRDRRLAVIARGSAGVEYALGITTWSSDVVLCTHGPMRMSHSNRTKLAAHGVGWRTERIVQLEHAAGALRRIVFEDGSTLRRDALFFDGETRQHCDLAGSLGCSFTRDGAVRTGELAASLPGLYVAGDAAREVHFVTVAAAEGLKAAFAINKELRAERSRSLLAPQRGEAGWIDVTALHGFEQPRDGSRTRRVPRGAQAVHDPRRI